MTMFSRFKTRPGLALGLAAALIVGGLLQLTNTNPAASQSMGLTAYEVPDDPGLDPDNTVWDKVSSIRVPLSAQTGTYPSGGSVQTVGVQAVQHGERIFFRINWADTTQNDATTKVEDFADAVAIEFPASGASKIPSLCMGQADSAVNIWQWRADSNAGFRDPNLVYENSSVDSYPDTGTLFYTAREAGNPYANPDLTVQNLTSRAFGELTALDVQNVKGFGKHTSSGWAVVVSREFSSNALSTVTFKASGSMDVAFAVWDGEKDERNGRKAVSQFVTLHTAAAPAFEEGRSNTKVFGIAAGLLLGAAAIGAGLAFYGYREGRN